MSEPVLDSGRLLICLRDADVEFVIIGGFAATAQGVPHTTPDKDSCYATTLTTDWGDRRAYALNRSEELRNMSLFQRCSRIDLSPGVNDLDAGTIEVRKVARC
jgi:hypothetical protein